MKKWFVVAVVAALILVALGRPISRNIGGFPKGEPAHAAPAASPSVTNAADAGTHEPCGPGVRMAGESGAPRPDGAPPIPPTNAFRAAPAPAHDPADPAADSQPQSVPSAWPSLTAHAAASETEMAFLVVRLQDGPATLLEQAVVTGNMRLPEAFAPERGVYYRVLSSEGGMLAQGLLPDPRLVHYDEPVDGGNGLLRGGTVMLPSAELNLRFPRIAGMDRVELFLVDEATDLRRLTDASKECCGSFQITARAR